MKPNQAAKAILDSIKYIAIATVSNDGQPWNTPVEQFHFNDDYTFYWASWQKNQHSQNIRANGKAFAVVYDSTPADGNPSAGVYIQGHAYELTDEKEVLQSASVFEGGAYTPTDGHQYLDAYPRRIYKFVPEKLWMNSDDEVNGNFVDTRKEAST